MNISNKDRIVVILCVIAVLTIFLYFEVKRANDAPVADETQFAQMTETISTIGKPICHFHGKLDVYSTHPPLYPYILTLFRWGGILSMRLFGVFLYLITTVFALYIPVLFGMRPNIYYYPIGLAFMLLVPIAISGAGLIDIDTGLLPVMLLVSVFAIMKYVLKEGWCWFILSIIAVLLTGLTKLTTSLALIPLALVISLVMKRGFKTKPFLAVAVGLSLSTIIYLILNRTYLHTGVETIIAKMMPTFSPITILKQITVLTLWFSPYLFITFLFTSIIRYREISNPLRVNFLLGLIIFITYIFIGGTGYGFPKYHFALLPLIMPAVALIVSKEIANIDRRTVIIIFIGGVISLLCAILIRDFLLLPYIANDDLAMGYRNLDEIRAGLIFQTLIMIIPLLIPIYFLIIKRKRFLFSITIVSMLFLVPQTIYMSGADYQVRYNYGERGFDRVVQITKVFYKQDRSLIMADDIAYNAGISGDYEEATGYLNEGGLAKKMSEVGNIYVIIRSSYVNNKPWRDEAGRVLELVGRNYGIVKVGHFMVFMPIQK
jgi:hypothetical protein